MKRMSIFRFSVAWKVLLTTEVGLGVGASNVRELQAQISGSAEATATQRVTAHTRRQRSGTRPFI